MRRDIESRSVVRGKRGKKEENVEKILRSKGEGIEREDVLGEKQSREGV